MAQDLDRDIEMGRIRGERKGGAPEETDYRPVNWKRIFLTPKYIRGQPEHLDSPD